MNRSRALLVLSVLLAAAVAQLSGANPAGAITPTFTPDTLTSNHLYSLTNYVDGEAVAWADYNGDGNLDLLVTPGSSGGTGGYPSGTYLYKGDGLGGFTEDTTAEANLADVSSGAVAWGDYNGDGKPEILLTGLSFATTGHPSTPVARLYKQNSSGVYVEDKVADANLTGVQNSSVAWGDYNNDGRPDILLSGTNASSQPTLKLYENNGDGTFTDISASAGLTWDTSTEVFPGLVNGSVAWGDYNNDGYLDILVTGGTGFSGTDSIHPARVAKILENNGDGSFSEDKTADPSLTPVENSAAAWGDYDNDGDLDILLAGCDNSSGACVSVVSKVDTNNGSGSAFNFTQYLPTASLQGSKDGGAAWGDYNSDGKPDILLSGDDAGTHPLAGKAYANTGSPGFTVDSTGFQIPSPGTTGPGTAAFGDYNNDGRLDAVLTGSFKTNIFQNTSSTADTAPTVPAGPTVSRGSTSATFSWTPSTDTQQPSAGLTYNLRVGTTPGGSDVVPSMSLSSGKRLAPAPGNVGEATSYTLTGLTPGVPYYWSVQAVDASFMASAFSAEQVFALGYTADNTTFPGIEGGTVAFGDYNSDGRLDAVVTGTDSSSNPIAKVYHQVYTQHCGGFPPLCFHFWTWSEDTSANLTAVSDSSAAWGDYNNDGHLDLLIAGMHNSTPTTTLYTGDGTGAFTADASASFVGVLRGAVAFVDYNSDGRPDVLVTGWDNGSHTYAKLYRNNGGGSFSEDTTAEAGLVGVNFSSIAVGDYNRDGRPDLLISGSTAPNSSSPAMTKLYRNNGDGTFTDLTTSAGLSAAAIEEGTVAWGDYNSDGWPDILASGKDSSGSGSAKVYTNNGNGTFTQDASAALPWQQQGAAAWGDYNADGKPDILLAGLTPSGPISGIFENQGNGAFADIGASLTGVTGSSVAWGDYNADGKLDALVAGCTVGTGGGCTDSSDTTTLYSSSIGTNAAPAAPSGLAASFSSGVENLSWSAPSDDHTASGALSYNLRVGTSSGGTEIVSPLSLSAGTRLVPQDGNVGERTSYALAGLTPGTTYHWSVQAVDSGFAGSAFASEGTFTVPESFALSASAYTVGEAGGHATITINRSGWTAGSASVHFATANGTATAGSDYTAVSQSVSFAAGETSKTVSIPITDDSAVENSETVLLSLSSPSSGATLGSPSSATLTIVDNDVAPPPTTKPATTTSKGKIVSCKVSKTSFSSSQAGKVKLTCKFSPKSKVFRYALSLKKGKKWAVVKSVKKTGSFKTYTLRFKKLFAGKPIKRGSYRLKLSADKNSKTLKFKVK
jgi:hypothetical protein